MSENDPRFDYPESFVNKHILGCFEASKACAILPGKPHLFHAEFLKRDDKHCKDLINQGMGAYHFVEVKYSPCSEVSWYLHTREKIESYENQETADQAYVDANSAGVIDRRENARLSDILPETSFTHTLPDRDDYEYKRAVAAQHVQETLQRLGLELTTTSGRISASHPNVSNSPKDKQTSPKISQDIMTDTFGCPGCVLVNRSHSRACQKRRSRYDKISSMDPWIFTKSAALPTSRLWSSTRRQWRLTRPLCRGCRIKDED